MSKSTTISAVFAIWCVSAISILTICKLGGIQVPIVDKIPTWEWLELLVKFFGLLVD